MDAIIRNKMQSDILFASSDAALRKAVSKAVKENTLRRILPAVYTSAIHDEDQDIVKRNLYPILGRLYKGAIISHRSACAGGVEDQHIVLSYKYDKKIELPGITVHLIDAPPPLPSDLPFIGSLYIASAPRAWLENLQNLHGHGFKKTLNQAKLEEMFCNEIRIYGEDKFKENIQDAEQISIELDMKSEFQKLRLIADAILQKSNDTTILKSDLARQRAFGQPYDAERIALFQSLYAFLKNANNLPDPIFLKHSLTSNRSASSLCFYDAYFSNYIEGTRFELDEARRIVFEGYSPENRPESHDVSATFQTLYNIHSTKPDDPIDAGQLIEQSKNYHSAIMKSHPGAAPGLFKDRPNYAGHTSFVAPELVVGTFLKAFELYRLLPKGFAKSAFLGFALAEIHPFLDGNGRLSRIFMNKELYAAQQLPIIIPNVYRNDYLGALRKLTRTHQPQIYVKMLARAQAFVASLDWNSFDSANLGLVKANAYSDEQEHNLVF